MITIDGDYGEGGGQILRISLALSAITGEPFLIKNIRKNRPNPGLRPQHLNAVNALAEMTSAKVRGNRINSTELYFEPGEIKGGRYVVDTRTAGSVTLILQAIIPPALHSDSDCEFVITGGTDVSWSPTADYFKNITLRALREMGGNVRMEIVRRGYYPEGGGKVVVRTQPSQLRGVKFEGIDEEIRGISHCSNLPRHVAERQAETVKRILEGRGYHADIDVKRERGVSTGSGITLWCGWKGGSALGKKGKRAEVVGKEAADELLQEMESEALFDRWLGDQMIIFGAIAKGKTRYTTSEITSHCRTGIYTVEKFLGSTVEVKENTLEISGKGPM